MLDKSNFADLIALSLMAEVLQKIADEYQSAGKDGLPKKEVIEPDENRRHTNEVQDRVNRMSMPANVVDDECSKRIQSYLRLTSLNFAFFCASLLSVSAGAFRKNSSVCAIPTLNGKRCVYPRSLSALAIEKP
jgi:hypothetical protein